MIVWEEPTDEQRATYAAWAAGRPPHVRAVAERFNPWTMYKLATTGQRCRVIGYHADEDDDPRSRVTAYLYVENPVLGQLTGRNVFGIDPADVVPWTDADEPEGMSRGVGGGVEVDAVEYGPASIAVTVRPVRS